MAIPSGSGTEVLKRYTRNSLSNGTITAITGVANHIYTILSIIICENGDAAENISISMNDGSNQIDLVYNAPIPAYGTYIFNDKFVISGTDTLLIRSHAASALDIIVSYIDQDWT